MAQVMDEAEEDHGAQAQVGGFEMDVLGDDAGIEFFQMAEGFFRFANQNEERRIEKHVGLTQFLFCFLVDLTKQRRVLHHSQHIAGVIVFPHRCSHGGFQKGIDVLLAHRLRRVRPRGFSKCEYLIEFHFPFLLIRNEEP